MNKSLKIVATVHEELRNQSVSIFFLLLRYQALAHTMVSGSEEQAGKGQGLLREPWAVLGILRGSVNSPETSQMWEGEQGSVQQKESL